MESLDKKLEKLKEILLNIKKYVIKNKINEKKETVNKKDNLEQKTSLGCMSYEYLKLIKKYQIVNGREHNAYYLFLLLFFSCKLKVMTSGKNINLFNDTFKRGNFPVPVECQKYVYYDNLDSIKNIENIKEYIVPLSEDEKVMKYVCDTYGILSFNELLKKYENDSLFKNTEYWEDINIENINLINSEEKDYITKVLKRYEM